jgi:hypothetical protein
MAASMLARLLGKAVSKTGSKKSSEVAKKGTELIGRRDEKFMGMAEEVAPKRLSGPSTKEAAKETAKEAEKKGGKVGAAIAGGAAATGVAALASRDKESKGSESKGRSFQEDRPTRDAGRVSAKSEETSKSKESDKKPSTFGAAFKEARSAGKSVFTYEGKKYTTELASEKNAAPKAADKPSAAKSTGVREGRNEKIDDDTRKRARAFVESKSGPRALASEDDATKRLNKGGMVKANCGASVPPAQKAKK